MELGMMVVVTLLLMLFIGIGGREPDWMGSGTAAKAEMLLSLSPWYLLIAGALIAFMSMIGCFMTYLPALLAVNCTRRNAFWSLLLMHLALIGAVEILCWIIWGRLDNDIALSGRELLLPAFGWLVAAVAVGGIMGCAVARWGKTGIIAAAGALFGGGMGLGFYSGYSEGFRELLSNMAGAATKENLFVGVSLGGGAALFLLMALLAAAVIRKMEARL